MTQILESVRTADVQFLDTASDHYLDMQVNEDLTADRTLNVTVSDADRALALHADLTVSTACTLDQDLQQSASPTFADVYVPDGGTVGVSGGPLWTFDDTNGDITTQHNVGIGTTGPGRRLTLAGNDGGGYLGIRLENNLAGAEDYQILTSSNLSAKGAGKFMIHNADDSRFDFTIDGTGNIGLGTDDPGTAGLAVMNGNVGIGTIAPGQILDVNAGSGNMIADGYDTHSLAQYKEQVQSVTGALDKLLSAPPKSWRRKPHVSADELRQYAIDTFGQERWDEAFPENEYRGGRLWDCPDAEMLAAMERRQGELRAERRNKPRWQRRHYGLVANAQEVLDNLPEVVSRDYETDEPVGYSLNNYVGLLHAAIIEQQQRIEDLEAQLVA